MDWAAGVFPQPLVSTNFKHIRKKLGGVVRARDAVTQVTEYGANGIPLRSLINTHTHPFETDTVPTLKLLTVTAWGKH